MVHIKISANFCSVFGGKLPECNSSSFIHCFPGLFLIKILHQFLHLVMLSEPGDLQK